jgi:channel protein (hemolysin III family)
MKKMSTTVLVALVLLFQGGVTVHAIGKINRRFESRTKEKVAPILPKKNKNKIVNGAATSTVKNNKTESPKKNLVYWDKPLLRGEFHRAGAWCYPPLLGVPLFLRAAPHNRLATILFSLAVEGIMIVSATLHTFPWTCPDKHNTARKADFAMIFVGIALLYSSIGKLLLGGHALYSSVIEPLVWVCAVVGVFTKWFIPDAPPWVNASIFLLQGWAVAPLVPMLFHETTCSKPEAIGLVLGGIFITLGATAYSVRWPDGHWKFHPDVFGPHEMFHIGTLLMFISFWYTMWMRVPR